MDNENDFYFRSPEELRKIVEGIEKMGRTRNFLEENLQLLYVLYPGQWIAVSDGSVLGQAKSYEEIWPIIDECFDRKSVIIKHINPNPPTLIL